MTWRRTGLVCLAMTLAVPVGAQQSPAASPVADAADGRILVPAGTVIELVTTNALSSKTNVKGDLLHLTVAAPLIVNGVTAIAPGTVVVGQVSSAETRGAFGKLGKIEVQLLYAELPGGTVRVSGTIGARGKADAGDAAATAAAFLVLPFVKTGRSAEIPAGAAVAGRLDRDLWLDRR